MEGWVDLDVAYVPGWFDSDQTGVNTWPHDHTITLPSHLQHCDTTTNTTTTITTTISMIPRHWSRQLMHEGRQWLQRWNCQLHWCPVPNVPQTQTQRLWEQELYQWIDSHSTHHDKPTTTTTPSAILQLLVTLLIFTPSRLIQHCVKKTSHLLLSIYLPNTNFYNVFTGTLSKICNKVTGYEDVVGPFGAGNPNNNSSHQLSLCSVHGLIVLGLRL